MSKSKRQNGKLDFVVEEHVVKTLRKMLANLIGEENRLWQMRDNRIQAEDIPETLPFERKMLETLYHFNMRGIQPTLENLSDALLVFGLDENVRVLATEVSEDRGVAPLAFILKRIYFRYARNLTLAERIREAFTSAEGMPEEHLREAMRLLATELPRAYTGLRMTDIEGLDYAVESLRQRVQKRKDGISPGPTWPFPKLRQMIPILMKGDLNTIMAKGGVGKTAFALLLAQYWAWQQNYDVLFVHLENNTIQIWDRILSHNTTTLVSMLRVGLADPDEDTLFAQKLNEFANTLRANTDRGRIITEHSPGITPEDLEAKVIMAREEAAARDKELIVVVDYYQEIDTSRWKNDPVPQDSCADWLKFLAETQDIYLVVTCQEHELQDGVPFGGRWILKRSQVLLRLHRDRVEAGQPRLFWGAEDNPLRDTMGHPRVKQEPGGFSPDGRIEILKANDGPPGIVQVITEMAYYRILQNDPDYVEDESR